ncbi:TonB system transport protein ExbD [Rhodopseudomonas sp. WA056]|uniref:TonB system transport protein ExbD n=1 Tax=Rhodopseudomonas sp. WA056 TaxID=2269367 RepID=UPI0013E069AC|nr:TonB system transport protein ExbD [Rhodopseudomonas sp. WA056]NEW85972.1 TonB system transport protein ExbD [Rhodopseudomonas sp. WA056]
MAGEVCESGGDRLDDKHRLNVPPLIDVMLVLLLIVMVAAPIAAADINVDRPASTAKSVPRADRPLYLTLNSNHTLRIGDNPVAREDLRAVIDRSVDGDKETRIFVRADKNVDYGSLMEVMDLLRGAGYPKVALVGLEMVTVLPPSAALP